MKLFPFIFRKHPPKIFISYRRKDSRSDARHLYEKLKNHFRRRFKNYFRQRALVVRDINSFEAAQDYRELIKENLSSCAAFITIIGEQWLTLTNPKTGQRRLDEPDDPLKSEIEIALAENIRIVPVLLEGANMPDADDLPEEIKKLAFINAIQISELRWEDDINRLIKLLEQILSQYEDKSGEAETQPRRPKPEISYSKVIGIFLGLVVIAMIGRWLYLSSGRDIPAGDFNANADTIVKSVENFDVGKYIAGINNVSPEFKNKVNKIAAQLDTNPNYLLAVISYETDGTMNPKLVNPETGAVGLIQLLPSTAAALGTTRNELKEMSAVEQLDFVAKYFAPFKGKLNSLENLYMAVLFPAAIDKDKEPNYVLFGKNKFELAYEQNKNLDFNQDGFVTVGEATVEIRKIFNAIPIEPKSNNPKPGQ
jgi:hypothetical protein